jgi:hypothetical protein
MGPLGAFRRARIVSTAPRATPSSDAFRARSYSAGYRCSSGIPLGYPSEEGRRFFFPEATHEAFFAIFWLLFIANVVLVIWVLVDAIKVPADPMFKAGTSSF